MQVKALQSLGYSVLELADKLLARLVRRHHDMLSLQLKLSFVEQ